MNRYIYNTMNILDTLNTMQTVGSEIKCLRAKLDKLMHHQSFHCDHCLPHDCTPQLYIEWKARVDKWATKIFEIHHMINVLIKSQNACVNAKPIADYVWE